jgi:hypothetical protein
MHETRGGFAEGERKILSCRRKSELGSLSNEIECHGNGADPCGVISKSKVEVIHISHTEHPHMCNNPPVFDVRNVQVHSRAIAISDSAPWWIISKI